MKWFKLPVDIINDPVIVAFRSQFGDAGIGRLTLLWTAAMRTNIPERIGMVVDQTGHPSRVDDVALALNIPLADLRDMVNFLATRRHIDPRQWKRSRIELPMEAADATVRELLLTHVLKASVVEVALDLAVAMMRDQSDPLAARRAALEERLAQTEKALANLASTIETMGPVPSIVEALKARDADRQRFLDELVPLQAMAGRTSTWTDAALRRALHAKLDDWRGLVDGHVAQARTILDAVLADRITFVKEKDASGCEVWAVSAPLAWDRVLTRLAPDAFAGLQGLVASPAGFEPAFQP